jgi:hypothetical protein
MMRAPDFGSDVRWQEIKRLLGCVGLDADNVQVKGRPLRVELDRLREQYVEAEQHEMEIPTTLQIQRDIEEAIDEIARFRDTFAGTFAAYFVAKNWSLRRVRALPRENGNPYLFVGPLLGRGFSDMALTRVVQRMGRTETVHGFRSTFSDWAHEQTAHANHTIEISLAHAVGSDVEKAYRRGNMFGKRAKLMSDWAKYCCSPAVRASDNVVALR